VIDSCSIARVRIVAAIPAVALIAGSAAGLFVPDIPTLIPLVTMVAACATAVACRRRERWLIASVVVGFAAGGQALASRAWHEARASPLRLMFDEADASSLFATVEGVLRADASPSPSGVSLAVDVDCVVVFEPRASSTEPRVPSRELRPCHRASGGLLVSVGGALSAPILGEWRAGRRVRLPVVMRRATRYFDVDVPDGERSVQLRGISLVASAKSGALVELTARGSWVLERLGEVRAFSRRAIQSAVGRWSQRSAAIVTAIVIGDRAGLDEEVQQSLQRAGTYHVIAISGGNIAILAGLMLACFRWAGALGRTASLLAIAVLVAYGGLVGGGASVDRATLMAVVYFAARAADQRSPPINTLSLAAAILVAVQPFSVVDPAFVLTFGATLAILVVSPVVMERVPSKLRGICSLLVASAAAEALLFPAGALLFSRVTFAGLALNFLAIPLMAVAQIVGMAVVPLTLMSSTLAAAAGFVAHLGAEGLVRSADLVRFAPFVAFRVAPPSWWVVAAYYGALVSLWISRRKAVAALFAISVSTVCLSALWILLEPWSWLSARGDGRLHVSFLDVGQGDSAFIRLPHGATLLVDAGGLAGSTTFDIGDRVVAPVLRHAGVRRLDYLVLTHGDPDHIGGAAAIVEEFRPRHILEGIPVPPFVPLQVLHAAADAYRLDWRTVAAGDHLRMDDVDVAVLHPSPPDWERQRVRNDDSIVVDLRWHDVSIVLTGDIGKAVEHQLIPWLTPAPVRILKVPHHGSLTSSTPEFIHALKPTIAVFSAGRNNRFGHPAPEILERYRAEGVRILRTDESGEIDIATDGHSFDLRSYIK
jgi:competence protein ComEC